MKSQLWTKSQIPLQPEVALISPKLPKYFIILLNTRSQKKGKNAQKTILSVRQFRANIHEFLFFSSKKFVSISNEEDLLEQLAG